LRKFGDRCSRSDDEDELKDPCALPGSPAKPSEEAKRVRPYVPPRQTGFQSQRYTIEANRRIRYERILEGDTVATFLARISKQTKEEWHWLSRNGAHVADTEPMTWSWEPVNVREGELIDGDWRPGVPKRKFGPAPLPPPPPNRILIETPDLPDDALEASNRYMKFNVWKGSEKVAFWMPVATMVDEEMKIRRAVGNRFTVSKDNEFWWLLFSSGGPVLRGLEHGDDLEWQEGTEEEFRAYEEWRRE
jgi:hypothetical protein